MQSTDRASGDGDADDDVKPAPSISLGVPRSGRRAQADQRIEDGGRSKAKTTLSLKADLAIRATDNDAMGSRLSAVLQGYIPADPFTRLLASNEASTSATLSRRSPIINIGTYLRCMAVDRLVGRFLTLDRKPKQIVSLGAGSDSRYWRIQSQSGLVETYNLQHYVELDFAELTAAKIDRIKRNKSLTSLVHITEDVDKSDSALLRTNGYSIIPCDLRTFADDPKAQQSVMQSLDPDVDTLIVAECVLAYLSPDESKGLLETFGRLLHKTNAICYEMCVAGDEGQAINEASPSRFGSVMLSNLQSRNLSMPGARAFATLNSHARRFEQTLNIDKRHACGKGTARTLKAVWHDQADAEKARLSRIERLDEIEELDILLAHYAVSWYTHDAEKNRDFVLPGL